MTKPTAVMSLDLSTPIRPPLRDRKFANSIAPTRNRWFANSLLEGGGFELPVPDHKGRRFRRATEGADAFERTVCMDTSNVDNVFVAGKVAKWQGKLVGIDLSRVRRMIEKSRDGVLARAGYSSDRFGTCCSA